MECSSPRSIASAWGLTATFELCVISVSAPGQPSAIACYNLRRQMSYKRFHPVDTNLQIGALAMHTDGQVVAVRIESPGGSAPPCSASSKPSRSAWSRLMRPPVVNGSRR